MKNKLIISWLFSTFFVFTTFAQFVDEIKVESGSFDFLKDQKQINVIVTYNNMKFYKDKLSENEYLAKRKKEIEKKNPGEYKNWLNHWNECKKSIFINQFITNINKQSKKTGITYSQNSKAKYTLILETKWIYPGWFGGVMDQEAKVSTLIKFVESNNKNKILLTIYFDKAHSNTTINGTANNNIRISEGYGNTGKLLGMVIRKRLKKMK